MNLGACAAGAPLRSVHHHLLHKQQPTKRICVRVRVRTDGGGGGGGGDSSYLEMWKKAVERERKSAHFNTVSDRSASRYETAVEGDLEKKTTEFQKLLEISTEERDRAQRMQVIDRAAAAIAAARSLIQERAEAESNAAAADQHDDNLTELGLGMGIQNRGILVPESDSQSNGIPGPDFWSWTPPMDSNITDMPLDDDDDDGGGGGGLQFDSKSYVRSSLPFPLAEKEWSPQFLSIPFESSLSQSEHSATIPPLQSSSEVEASASILESPSLEEEEERSALSFDYAAEIANALKEAGKSSPLGMNPDGSRWWKETGTERRPDGVICRWTMTRGVSADKAVEWQEKYWEAADEFGYKELGSEKSGRDAHGNVWREFWRESMREENGLMYFEKTADKWGRNGNGNEWQEKWWEKYNASGQTEKWADKWCSIDPNTPLDPGHAHVWHERWGETYDGYGGSTKYTDKWAERSVEGGWEKWGDKWDENFDLNCNGVKQGETWWEGRHGDRWNRTWGEQHNGSGWVHKYGKSSSGEHWDTHVMQDTWYERFPHYGFYHCFENSVQLREVPKPSEVQEP